MIEDIVQMVLKESRGRTSEDSVSNIYRVMKEIETEIIGIIEVIRINQRRLNKNDQCFEIPGRISKEIKCPRA